MSMKSSNAPRRIYTKSGQHLLCFAGLLFAPKQEKDSTINPDKTVKVEVMEKKGSGKAVVTVAQGHGAKKVEETWVEQPRSR